jgi:hypothetical protein
MFNQFRVHYPKGSLITELQTIDHGKYVVRCLVQDEGRTLVTGLAAAQTVELAEDQARNRALAFLGIYPTAPTEEKETPLTTNDEVPTALTPTPKASPEFSDAPGVATATLSESLRQTKPPRFSESLIASEASSLSFSTQKSGVANNHAATTPLVADDEIPFSDDFSPDEVETSQDVENPLWMTQKNELTQPNDVPATSYLPKEPETDTSRVPETSTPVDFSDIIARTNVELKRLGWTNHQGRDYLLQTYGKRSRQLLTDAELLDFLHHLESEPAPE